jgi:tetratricopeptide (TPR) repeat protein
MAPMSVTAPSHLAKLEGALKAHRQGQLDTAAALYREILATNPAHFDSLHLLGVVEMNRGDAALAVELIGKALQINKRSAPAHSNMGLALRALARYSEALSACDRAIAAQSDNVLAHYNRALILLDMARYEQALTGFRKTLGMNPNLREAHTNMGVALQAMGRLEEALESFVKADALQPRNADTLHNIGCVNQLLRRRDAARTSFQNAIVCAPQHAEAHVGLSECLLQSGQYAEGWREYEWRWQVPSIIPLKRSFDQPTLSGQENVAGKTILIHAEQGLGDTLQFARYIQILRERGAQIILEVQAPLKPLFAAQDGLAHVLAKDEALPAFDLHCPLLSLPMVLNTGSDFVTAPYIHAPSAAVEKWRDRLGTATAPRCGVVWSGSTITRGTGRFRSIPLETFKRISEACVALVGLQRDVRDSDQATLSAFADINNLGPDLQDFADTAGLIANLDLVVTVDTAVAHLAGAMGKSVWILLAHAPDWRWDIDTDGENVWYPTARLFRQSTLLDWNPVIDRVIAELKTHFPG